VLADGKSDRAFFSLLLVRGGGPDCGVKGNVARLTVSRAGLDVTPAFALGARLAAPAALTPGELVKLGVQPPRDLKLFSRLNFLTAFPPPGILILKNLLLGGRFGRA
jgi:hypothetical protein